MALYFIPKYQVRSGKSPLFTQKNLMSLNLEKHPNKFQQLTKFLEIPPEEITERNSLCAELHQILKNFYPDSLLLVFGSTINSFGVKGCDLDLLFLPYPSYCNLDYTGSSAENEPIPEPSSILKGEVSKHVLSKFDEFSHLKFIRKVLRREKVGKINFIPNFIPSGKSPCVKVHLKNNQIVCEIVASNKLVVFNSELLQFFEKMDERVKPLVVSLKFWAKSLGFIKSSFLSNYAFTLLVIFFLQTIKPPVLPSVQNLISLSGFSRMIAGWQTAFTNDVNELPKTKNTLTVGELFLQFFDYYFHFDFKQYVVSPYYGRAVSIKDIKMVTDSKTDNFEIAPLNIQDVFILSCNICKTEKLTVFKLALLTAFKMVKNEVQFHSLFDSHEYQRVLDASYSTFMSVKPKVCFIPLDYDRMIKFENLQTWYYNACQAVYEVLQFGLLVECEITDTIYSRKNKDKSRLAYDEVSQSYDLQLLTSIQCVLFSRTWIGRKNVEVSISDTEDELEEFAESALSSEYFISKSIVNNNPKCSSPVPILCFKCDCYKHVSPHISKDVVVVLKPLSISKEFYQVSAFLASFLPKTVKKMLTIN